MDIYGIAPLTNQTTARTKQAKIFLAWLSAGISTRTELERLDSKDRALGLGEGQAPEFSGPDVLV